MSELKLMKLLEENKVRNLYDLEHDNWVLDLTPKVMNNKRKQSDFIKLKKLLCLKGHY